MQVEFLERVGSKGMKGDRKTVDDETGIRWCMAGFVKDMAGVVETGERNTNPVTVNPKSIISATENSEAQ